MFYACNNLIRLLIDYYFIIYDDQKYNTILGKIIIVTIAISWSNNAYNLHIIDYYFEEQEDIINDSAIIWSIKYYLSLIWRKNEERFCQDEGIDDVSQQMINSFLEEWSLPSIDHINNNHILPSRVSSSLLSYFFT